MIALVLSHEAIHQVHIIAALDLLVAAEIGCHAICLHLRVGVVTDARHHREAS